MSNALIAQARKEAEFWLHEDDLCVLLLALADALEAAQKSLTATPFAERARAMSTGGDLLRCVCGAGFSASPDNHSVECLERRFAEVESRLEAVQSERDEVLRELDNACKLVVWVSDTMREALKQIADFGHELDDYDLPPKQARKIARAALAALPEKLA